MQRIVSAVRTHRPDDDFLYFNGLPTAELTGLAYRGIGITLYSSAVFAFAPDIALAFHRALDSGDDALANALLDHFYRPLVELRAQGRGYAVSWSRPVSGSRAWTSARCVPPSPNRPPHTSRTSSRSSRAAAPCWRSAPPRSVPLRAHSAEGTPLREAGREGGRLPLPVGRRR